MDDIVAYWSIQFWSNSLATALDILSRTAFWLLLNEASEMNLALHSKQGGATKSWNLPFWLHFCACFIDLSTQILFDQLHI